MVKANQGEAEHMSLETPLLSLAFCAVWVISTLAHHTENSAPPCCSTLGCLTVRRHLCLPMTTTCASSASPTRTGLRTSCLLCRLETA